MIKKSTAIFFLLLANLVLLAHAVIPHHHHNSQVCITNSYSNSKSEAENNCSSDHKHKHEGNKNTESCILKQIVVVPSNNIKQEFKYFEYKDIHFQFNDFQSIIYYSELETFVKILRTNTEAPLIPSFYTQYLNSGLGLRAPPIV